MLLSDGTIRRMIADGRIRLDPYYPELVQPASIDVRLGPRFVVFRRTSAAYIDPANLTDDLFEEVNISGGRRFIMHPGEFALASTVEHLELPNNISARLEGKSSLGRIGLVIHSTAGFVDAGWKGELTLELNNVAVMPIMLREGMRIGQLSFMSMDRPAERPYGSEGLGSRYQGQSGPTPARNDGEPGEATPRTESDEDQEADDQ